MSSCFRRVGFAQAVVSLYGFMAELDTGWGRYRDIVTAASQRAYEHTSPGSLFLSGCQHAAACVASALPSLSNPADIEPVEKSISPSQRQGRGPGSGGVSGNPAGNARRIRPRLEAR